MAKIIISGTEEKKPVTGTTGGTTGTTGGSTGTTGTTGTTATNTGAGTTITPGKASENKTGGSTSFSDILSKLFGNNTNTETATPTEPVIPAETKAETSVADLKNKYSENLREQYNYSAEKLKNERDEALRENWILQQQAEAALPEQMAAAGINGGASETSLAALKARYQSDRNSIRNNYINNLGELTQQNQAERAEAERNYNERWLDYLLNLAQMEQQHKYDKELM